MEDVEDVADVFKPALVGRSTKSDWNLEVGVTTSVVSFPFVRLTF